MRYRTLLRRWLLLSLVFVCLVNTVFATGIDSSNEDGTVVSGCYSLSATQQVIGSEIKISNAKAGFLYEASTQTLMYALNPDIQLPPSSLVKIMTALLVAEKADLTKAVTIQQTTLDTVPKDAVDVKLQPGEVISIGDLLYCMMVGSGNDAAAVLAEEVAGSQSAFVAMMNERALTLGCTGTTFVNVHGLHHDQQLTTARDTARILVAAMENDVFRVVFTTVSYNVPATNLSEQRFLSSSNFLCNDSDMPLYFDERATGGRTGVANDGTRCLAATAEKDGMQLISVLMGSKDELAENGKSVKVYGGFNETKLLLDAGFTGYKPAQILFEGQVLAQRGVTDGGNKVSLGANVDVATVLPARVTVQDLAFRYEDGGNNVKAPIKKGDRITGVEIWYGGLCVAKTDLYAMNDVQFGSGFEIGIKSGSNTSVWKIVLIVIAVLLAVAVVVLLGLRFTAKMRRLSAKKRSRRRLQSRRRS